MNLSSPVGRVTASFRRHLMPLLGMAMCATVQAQVGMSTLNVGEVPVTLVYPSAQVAQAHLFGPFELNVARGAAPLTGVRRLAVLSHGTGGNALADHDLAATLARAGFVVAQPQHQGDNFQDTSAAGPGAWVPRPQEVSQVIDALARHPQWQPLLALDRVGVHGMSAGGLTALSPAGAQWRVLDLVRHCQAQADADFGFCFCFCFCFNGVVDAQAQAARRARYDSARNVPELFLPADMKAVHGGRTPAGADDEVRPDPRVAAVSVSVPVAAVLSAQSLARLRIPVGVVTAGRDTMLLPEFRSAHVLRSCQSCTLLAHLPGAAHMDLLSPWPDSVARGVAARQARGAVPEPGFDPRKREAAFASIAAFFSRTLTR